MNDPSHPSPVTAPLRGRGGGLAAWSIHHPVGVSMIALALVVLGAFFVQGLAVDLLPHIIYPEVRVRIIDPGVPATVMEDRVTRQLEEQLAITEDAVSIESRTSEGRSSVDLSFPYGKDIDVALRDASTRLDRAKRFLPDSIEPPVIFKRDPSQIPVAEFVVSSNQRSMVELRDWVDYRLANWFVNLPGVAAAEVGGGVEREVWVMPNQRRLQAQGLSLDDLAQALRQEHLETPLGRLRLPDQETSARLLGRFDDSADLARIPLRHAGPGTPPVYLGEVAQVIDTHADESLRIRFDGVPGIKLSVQKQPRANTVAVVDAVKQRLQWLQQNKLLPPDIRVDTVSDQSVYVRNALRNAGGAVAGGALLAMLVVYLFLGDLRRTLIIGSAIPIALMVTFSLMYLGGLSLNIMTLGGLAVGVGMLVDSAIVMLENITRHQHQQESADAAIDAAREVNSAIVASTSTNLAAILPFLFIGGLTGLLFQELIFTIAAATLAALLGALTLIPALAAKVHPRAQRRSRVGLAIKNAYAALLRQLLRLPWLLPVLFCGGLALSWPVFQNAPQEFLPSLDEGRVQVSVTAEPGISLDSMDALVQQLEHLFSSQPEVVSVYSQIGGHVFGRSVSEATHRSSLLLQLRPVTERAKTTRAWIKDIQPQVEALGLVGVEIRLRSEGVRGIRLSQGDDDISLRLQGDDLETLASLADALLQHLKDVPGLSNLRHSAEEEGRELAVEFDRPRAAALGFSLEDSGETLRTLINGTTVGEFIANDRQYDIRLRLRQNALSSPADFANLLLYNDAGLAVRLGELAQLRWLTSPAEIFRDQRRRAVEISASLDQSATLGQVMERVWARLADYPLPENYMLYDAGSAKQLQEGQRLGMLLLGLAVFLVFVVMAVQYESLRNPLVILLSVPFAACGVAIAVVLLEMPLSMPVWLGLVMLAGIVVNNTIVLVESIEIQRAGGDGLDAAIVNAARLRLRPIIMTSLTTVMGMSPLALGWGEGAEMLQPLAITIVFGLGFSVIVSLLLVPNVYKLLGRKTPQGAG